MREGAVRVARGVFIKPDRKDSVWRPSLEQIAEIKLRAFGRVGIMNPDTEPLCGQILPTKKPLEPELRLETNGSTSSFQCETQGKVMLHRRAPRKILLAQSEPGPKIRVLWNKGKRKLTDNDLDTFWRSISFRSEAHEVKRILHLMPWWLSNKLGAPWEHLWQRITLPQPATMCAPPSWLNLRVLLPQLLAAPADQPTTS